MEIIRHMVVANDKGRTVQFVPGPIPKDTSPATLARLKRAGALGDTRPEKPATDSGSDQAETDLDKMTKGELLAYVETHNLDVNKDQNKAPLLEAIKAAVAARDTA